MALPIVPAIVAAILLQDAAPPSRGECRDVADCRQRAVDAAERKDYEAFHDFAWRAAQKGPPGEPSLLFLVARAQSLSGRPHDALVMLRRLAAQAVAREAVTSEDFTRVRALAAWPEVEAMIAAGPKDPAPGVTATAGVPAAAPTTEVRKAGSSDLSAPVAFNAGSFRPSTLAYDRVSRRFIIADSDISRLAVVDEFTHNMATLASGAPDGGFGTVTAIDIDTREGDLWVASVDAAGKPSLHKLQLISARVLKAFALRSGNAPLRDLVVAPDGSIVAVDARRILRLLRGASGFDTVATLTDAEISGVAVSSDGVIYVAEPNHIRRVGRGRLKAAPGVDLSKISKIRWSRGSIVGLQETGDVGTHRLVQIRLSGDGQTANRLNVLDPSVRSAHPAMTIVDGVVYYLTEGDGTGAIIRRAKLQVP